MRGDEDERVGVEPSATTRDGRLDGLVGAVFGWTAGGFMLTQSAGIDGRRLRLMYGTTRTLPAHCHLGVVCELHELV